MIQYESELMHHGVKGMKWGVRRYQNADGSLTAEGQQMYTKRQVRKAGRKAMRAELKARKKSTSFFKRGADYMDKQTATRYKYASQMHNAYASKAKTGSREQIRRQSQAFNASQMQKHYTDRASAKKFKGANMERMFNIPSKKLWNTKMKTMSGKDTTKGKEILKAIAIGVAVSTAEEIAKRKMTSGY